MTERTSCGCYDVGDDQDYNYGDWQREIFSVSLHYVPFDGLKELTVLQPAVSGIYGLHHPDQLPLRINHEDDEECQQSSMDEEVEDTYEERDGPETQTAGPHCLPHRVGV